MTESILWATKTGDCIGFGGAAELRAVLAAGYRPICIDLDGCLAAFVREYPDQTKVFLVADILKVTALTKRAFEDWVARGVLLPDLSRRARRVPRQWSWRGAFWAATLATLGRAGVEQVALAKIAQAISDAKPRPVIERERVPAIMIED